MPLCRRATPFLPAGKARVNRLGQHSGALVVLIGTRMSFRKLSALRACGEDDATANRTPSAWMISLAAFLARRQIVFFAWVTLNEYKWVILAARRPMFLCYYCQKRRR